MTTEHVTPKTSNGTRAYYHDAGLMVLAADYEKADQTIKLLKNQVAEAVRLSGFDTGSDERIQMMLRVLANK